MSEPVILGGGIAGLAASWYARRRGQAPVVYEALERSGGILDSFVLEHGGAAWQFDNGVHLSFASEPEVRAVFDRTPYIEHEAKSLCWDNGHWLRHPVQNNMYPLPAEEKTRLIAGLVEQPQSAVENYRDWLVFQYGEPIAARWPLAYTRKYWTLDAAEMGTDWIGSRMRRADLREVLFGAMSPEAPNTYYISRMRYPERGGYGAFIAPLRADADIRTSHRAVAVDWRTRRVTFANGAEIPYGHLISTIPLPALVDMMPDVPGEVREAAATLFATRVDLVSFGFRRPSVSPSLWFYIYDSDIVASRAYSPSWKSSHNAPEGCSSLQFEIYSSVRAPLTATPEEMKANCMAALEKMGLARPEDILFVHHKILPYANVVFDLGMEARRDRVRDWVESKGIRLAGRFGKWEYLWSNQSFMSGMQAALV